MSDIPDKAIGFVYIIRHLESGKLYIGRKLLKSKKTKTVKGKKKSTYVDSDWRDYWSSSPGLKEEIDRLGYDAFEREIIAFVNSKGALTYMEELALYMSGALERDDFYNNNIRSRIQRSWVYQKCDTQELREAIQSLSSSKTSSSSAISEPQKGQ